MSLHLELTFRGSEERNMLSVGSRVVREGLPATRPPGFLQQYVGLSSLVSRAACVFPLPPLSFLFHRRRGKGSAAEEAGSR